MNTRSDERPCPLCGGTIKVAAMYCKHCRRDVSLAPLSPLPPLQPLPPPPQRRQSAAAPRPAIVEELRAFLVERGAVDAPTFEQSVPAESVLDAAQAIAHLGLISVLAEAQLDNIRDAFRASQIARVRELLVSAEKRGLLSTDQVEKGVTEFSSTVFTTTPVEFVIRKGFLTAAQIPGTSKPQTEPSMQYAAPANPGGSPPMGTSPSSAAWPPPARPESSMPLHAGGAPGVGRTLGSLLIMGTGMAVAAWVVLLFLYDVGLSTDALFAVLVVPPALVWTMAKSASTRVRAWSIGTTVAVALVGFGVFPRLNRALFGPPPLRPECVMDGTGRGRCVFSNVGSTWPHANSGCGHIAVTCQSSRIAPQSSESPSICSVPLRPGRSSTEFFTVPGFDLIRDRVVPWSGDWRRYCSFEWVPQ